MSSDWTLIIKPQSRLIDFKIKEIWHYRDLLTLFVRRDFVTLYKQTILGPLWFFIQPILTTLVYVVIFGRIAKISTDGLPQILFYLSGIVMWNYFAACLRGTSETFYSNVNLFGKVYFPRIITPLSLIISKLFAFGVQFLLFLVIYFVYLARGTQIEPNVLIILFPFLILITAGLSIGFGLIITSLTTKYRDFRFLLQFIIQLAMYATPVIYPISTIPEKYRWIIVANPMTSILETFRFSFLGAGTFSWFNLLYSALFTLVILFIGTIVFNRVERTFMDTV